MIKMHLWVIALGCFVFSEAQPGYWQQSVSYKMNVQLLPAQNLITGDQTILYTNHSPDTLNELFFHTYWNAFQPNSNMDLRSRENGQKIIGRDRKGADVLDWDIRVKDRIQKLKPEEQGFQKINSITINGKRQETKSYGTIEKILLSNPITPGQSVTIRTQFQAQVPVQIRRSGRNSAEGIQFSMSQWYPKICEYDRDGWHPNPYVAREFYGVWGDYEVNITAPARYILAGTGLSLAKKLEPTNIIQAKDEEPRQTWQFKAQRVHDFVWAADTAYQQISRKVPNGPVFRFYFKRKDAETERLWNATADTIALAYPYIRQNFGSYPWPQYSFIQGGDGGMEYAMATLVRSHSVGTAVHEFMHSWYQHLLGNNESLYSWMDEGFTSYAESRVLHEVRKQGGFEFEDDYLGYYNLAASKWEEPLTTHADHFFTNFAFSKGSYSKGTVFVAQLGYIIGTQALNQTLLKYYQLWKFKHPRPEDFLRIAEKESGMQLDWYQQYWINTTKQIDYAIDSLWYDGEQTQVRIKRLGEMPMPLEIEIKDRSGASELHVVPLDLAFGEKAYLKSEQVMLYPAQPWANRTIIVATRKKITEISSIEIDSSQLMADTDRNNNFLFLKW